ncbi:MAG: hypothetical protein WCI95_11660, partial [bacterium]
FLSGLIREPRTVAIWSATSKRWNRLRRFERVRDNSTTMRRHVPEKATDEITGSPGGATSNGAAGVRRGLFQHGA